MTTRRNRLAVIRVRIEWGGVSCYYDEGLFPYCWDGGLTVARGRLRSLRRLQIDAFGCGFRGERQIPIPGATWHSVTTDGMAGVLADLEGSDATRVTVTTIQKAVSFTLGELKRRKYLSWRVGAKYAGVLIRAMLEGAGPFEIDAYVPAGNLNVRLNAADFRGALRHGPFQREAGAWVAPGRSVQVRCPLTRRPWAGSDRRSRMLMELRLAYSAGVETTPLTESFQAELGLALNGAPIPVKPFFYRTMGAGTFFHKAWMEFLPVVVQDPALWRRNNRLTIENRSPHHLVLTSAQVRETVVRDLEITACPPWVLAGERFPITLNVLKPHDRCVFSCRGVTSERPLPTTLDVGVHTLWFTAGKEPMTASVMVREARAGDRKCFPVFAVPSEPVPWKVGAGLESVRYERGGELDEFLAYARDTRLGNYFPLRINPPHDFPGWTRVSPEDWAYWGRRYRELDLYFSMVGALAWNRIRMERLAKPTRAIYDACRALKETAGDRFFSTHFHEFSRWLYGFGPGFYNDPTPLTQGTMKDAHEKYVRDCMDIEGVPGIPRQAGESAPVMAYDYEGGMDYISVEPNALNASHIYAAMRGAAKAFGKSVWGTHNAVYWCKAPADITHLTLNYLTFYWTYLSGGNFAYSEDGHYNDYMADLQAGWQSESPVRLREIIRRFYRFVSTHPRPGRLRVDLAIAQGHHACELISSPLHFFNSKGTIGHVWGAKSTKEPKWAYSDAERGMELLDAFMPYWQDGQHIRHWFTGTPYGQFDVTPVTVASLEVLRTYRVLVFLGWNTMTPEIYAKLKAYVEQGGTLFMALPQLSLHADRQFLEDMVDLNLIQGGDFSDLFGVRIRGRLDTKRQIRAVWTQASKDRRWVTPVGYAYDLKGNDKRGLTADVELLGAQPLVVTQNQSLPILVEHQVKKGRAFLLTTWAYPGTAGLQPLMRDILHMLGDGSVGDVRLEDLSQEVAYTVWKGNHGVKTIGLLNTDWTAPGNVKPVRLVLNGHRVPLDIREGNFSLVTWLKHVAIWPENQDVFVESIRRDGPRTYIVVVHGAGRQRLHLGCLGLKLGALKWGECKIPFHWNTETSVADFTVNFGSLTRGKLIINLKA